MRIYALYYKIELCVLPDPPPPNCKVITVYDLAPFLDPVHRVSVSVSIQCTALLCRHW